MLSKHFDVVLCFFVHFVTKYGHNNIHTYPHWKNKTKKLYTETDIYMYTDDALKIFIYYNSSLTPLLYVSLFELSSSPHIAPVIIIIIKVEGGVSCYILLFKFLCVVKLVHFVSSLLSLVFLCIFPFPAFSFGHSKELLSTKKL